MRLGRTFSTLLDAISIYIIFDLILDNSSQYVTDCIISMLGTIVLSTGTLGFEHVMPTFGDFFGDFSPSLASRTA